MGLDAVKMKLITLKREARQSDAEIVSQLTELANVNKEIVHDLKCSICNCICKVPEQEVLDFKEFGCEQCYFDNNEANQLVWGAE